jgi:hypothetical protein
LDIADEKESADMEAAKQYSVTFEQLIKDNNLTADQIYNADEAGLYWTCLPTTTLADGTEKSASGLKQNKERITVLACANASGQHRVKLLVIGKFARSRLLKGLTHLPVVYNSQKNSWMEKETFLDWFIYNFIPSVRQKFRNFKKACKLQVCFTFG